MPSATIFLSTIVGGMPEVKDVLSTRWARGTQFNNLTGCIILVLGRLRVLILILVVVTAFVFVPIWVLFNIPFLAPVLGSPWRSPRVSFLLMF